MDTTIQVAKEFQTHLLNEEGIKKAQRMALDFDDLLFRLAAVCSNPSREFSIVRTKLEEACFFAKKAMAILLENQK